MIVVLVFSHIYFSIKYTHDDIDVCIGASDGLNSIFAQS